MKKTRSSIHHKLFLFLSASLFLHHSNGFILQTLGRGFMNPLASNSISMPSLANWAGGLMSGQLNTAPNCGGNTNPCQTAGSNLRPVNRLRRPRPSMVNLPNAMLSDYNSNPMMSNAIIMPLDQCKWCRDNNRFNGPPTKGGGRYKNKGQGKTNYPKVEQMKEPFEQKKEPFGQEKEVFGQMKESNYGSDDVQQKIEQVKSDRKSPRRDPIKSSSNIVSGPSNSLLIHQYSNQQNGKLKADENRFVIVVVHLNKNFMTDVKWKKLTANGTPLGSASLLTPTSSPLTNERDREVERENDRPADGPYFDETAWSSRRIQPPANNEYSPMINEPGTFTNGQRSSDIFENRKETSNGWTIMAKNP